MSIYHHRRRRRHHHHPAAEHLPNFGALQLSVMSRNYYDPV